MNKTILSVFILGISVVLAVILYGVVVSHYPTFGEFYNLLFLGLITFGLGIALFISGLVLEKSLKEIRN